MIRNRCSNCVLTLLVAIAFAKPSVEAVEKKAAPSAKDADQAQAVFQAKFDDYKAAIRDIEKLQTEFQTADGEARKKLNTTLAGQVAHAQSLVNAMVEAAEAAYRAAPNKDPQVLNLLLAVAKYDTIGRQVGPGAPSQRNPNDVFYPIDGGDQYERALPIIKLLIDGHAQDNELYVWGFLCAFMTNDYDLAKTYLAKAKANNAFDAIAMIAQKGDTADQQAGLMKTVTKTLTTCIATIDEYQELWKKESAIRAAEAKADDLPRVKLTTTKGEIIVELFENEAPQTVANFLTLVKQGYYKDTPFHRVLPQFMAQGGSKTDEGTGGPGYTIKCECYKPDYRRHFRGTLSMALHGRDTGSSQFFITTVATPHLNGGYTAFGRVIEGIEVLGDLQRRSPEHQTTPPKSDRILNAEVIRDRGHEYKFEKLPGE